MDNKSDLLIYPIKTNFITNEYSLLYDKILLLTQGRSNWNKFTLLKYYSIYPNIKITLQNDKLFYFIDKIKGELNPQTEFSIKISNNNFEFKKGNLEIFYEVIKRIENDSQVKKNLNIPIFIFKNYSLFIKEELNLWVKKGCYCNNNLKYKTIISFNNEIKIIEISTNNIKLDLLGLAKEYIEIIDKTTNECWKFTNDNKYALVYINNYNLIYSNNVYNENYKEHSNKDQYMTDELKEKSLNLLKPIKEILMLNCFIMTSLQYKNCK